MFAKILIANRGEIACRVMATARRLGVATVAVYSDADRDAKHVAMADEAVHIGPAAVAESYLRGERIIAAAKATGAEAIHPGYGFLSENPEFVEAVEAAGLAFIGPTAEAIRAMGLKDAAKALMEKAGVPVVPGYHGDSQDADFLAAEADKIGYPVLIKARAGGGGKGMRLVDTPAEFKTALEAAQREGQASFGDPACLIEKYITQPRHIEIQVFGDSHGNVVHLFERDCSLQRRHQKVIEEAPAPGMTEAMRTAMGKAAVEAAKAIGYRGAGTVEFIVDGSGPLSEDGFWFMEMNTRLQVEHPVSEQITGRDFVELQLRVASGEPLPFAQEDLRIDGWSFEARIYAEDAAKGFLPATGRLTHFGMPEGGEFTLAPVRVDSGVRAGDEISPWYDPMIAKLIVHGPTREAALGMLRRALARVHVSGCTTNVSFLSALATHEGFGKGEVDTGLIGRDQAALTEVPLPDAVEIAMAVVAASGVLLPDARGALAGFRAWGEAVHFVPLEVNGEVARFAVRLLGDDLYRVSVEGADHTIRLAPLGGTVFELETDVGRKRVDLVVTPARVTLFDGGVGHIFGRPDPLASAEGEGAGGDVIAAPMPGLVQQVLTKAGARVAKGDRLIVLEAMKMEHALSAPRAGVVAEVLASEGDQVTDGTVLLQLEPEDD